MKNKKLAEEQPLLECRADFEGGLIVSGRGLSHVVRACWYVLFLCIAASSLTLSLRFKANVQVENDVNLDIDGALPTVPVE